MEGLVAVYDDVGTLCKVLDYGRYNPVSVSGDIFPVTEDVYCVVINSRRIVVVWIELVVFAIGLLPISGCYG